MTDVLPKLFVGFFFCLVSGTSCATCPTDRPTNDKKKRTSKRGEGPSDWSMRNSRSPGLERGSKKKIRDDDSRTHRFFLDAVVVVVYFEKIKESRKKNEAAAAV